MNFVIKLFKSTDIESSFLFQKTIIVLINNYDYYRHNKL